MRTIALSTGFICFIIQFGLNSFGINENFKAKPEHEFLQSDTLEFISKGITIDPFSFEENLMPTLRSYENANILVKTRLNSEYENQIDTLFKVTIENDYFEIYKSFRSTLTKAHVSSKNFEIKNGIIVGMNKNTIKEKLGSQNMYIPNVLYLRDWGTTGKLFLIFKEDTLTSIHFDSEINF